MDELKPHSNDNGATPDHTAIPLDTWEDAPRYRRRTPWGKIAVLFIIVGAILSLAGWLTGARGGRVYFDNGLRIATFPLEGEENTPLDMTFSSANIHSISVNAASRGIRIVPTTAATPRVVSGSRNVTISETDGHLSIEAERFSGPINFMHVGIMGVNWNRGDGMHAMDFNFSPRDIFSGVSNTITVYVPSSVQNIEARTASGSIRINDVSTQTLDLRANSGSINVDGGTHGNATMQSTSGRVRASATFTGDIYARSTSGGIRIEDNSTSHANTNSIRLHATSGSVNFDTRAPISDFRYALSVSSGGMRVDGNRLDGRSASGGQGNTLIDARSSSGSIRLNFSS
jgi:DUF4097 and DUF4098 domain-containing protein YvlB